MFELDSIQLRVMDQIDHKVYCFFNFIFYQLPQGLLRFVVVMIRSNSFGHVNNPHYHANNLFD